MANPEDRNWIRILFVATIVIGVFYGVLALGVSSCTSAARYCSRTSQRRDCLPNYCPAVYGANTMATDAVITVVRIGTLGYVEVKHTSDLCNYFVCD